MKIVSDRSHPARKLECVCLQDPILITSRAPTIVENYIIVSKIPESIAHHCFGGIEKKRLVDITLLG